MERFKKQNMALVSFLICSSLKSHSQAGLANGNQYSYMLQKMFAQCATDSNGNYHHQVTFSGFSLTKAIFTPYLIPHVVLKTAQQNSQFYDASTYLTLFTFLV